MKYDPSGDVEDVVRSLSLRRAWIEMRNHASHVFGRFVALLTESVD